MAFRFPHFLVLAAAQHFNFMLGHISCQATMPFGLARTSVGASGNSCQLACCPLLCPGHVPVRGGSYFNLPPAKVAKDQKLNDKDNDNDNDNDEKENQDKD